jgi:hypothetical protein
VNTEIFSWLGPPWERWQERVKRTGRDEPVDIVIHICMETAQGISLCNYVYLKLAKTPCFSMFYDFSSTKSEKRCRNRFCQGGEGFAFVGGGDGRERCRRVNMMQIMYMHVKC